MKTNINFGGKAWVRSSAKCWVKSFIFLPHKYHTQISTEDSDILDLTKHAKTTNNSAGYNIFSRRVISTTSDI